MNRKTVSGMMLTLLLVGMLTSAFNIQLVRSEPATIMVPDDYPTIQEAINAANLGDMIIVREGIYCENVKVNKDRLIIKSENGAGATIVRATNPDDNVIEVVADYVNLSGFTIEGAPHSFRAGIWLRESEHCSISDNSASELGRDGIFLYDSSNNTIQNNTFSVSHASAAGIALWYSSHNTIRNNTCVGGNGIILWSRCHNNIISSNTVCNNDRYGIWVRKESSNNTLSHNTVSNNRIGFILDVCTRTDNVIARNNIVANDLFGIYLVLCSNNSIVGNCIENNWGGIGLAYESSNNTIYNNNFINNTRQIYDYSWDYSGVPSVNIWDDGYPSGGNYWSDYVEIYPSASEIDDSGIWDTPYEIDENNRDNYPLMEPYSPLPRTIGELKSEIEELGLEGEIDNQGIVTSLLAKLDVAQKLIEEGKIDQAKNTLNAFINEVQVQSGKHITPETAEILIESAEHILSDL